MKEISKELFEEFFEYDETSKSCLRWKKKPNPKASEIKTGDEAGTLNSSGYYVVKLNQVLYYCHRVVMVLQKSVNITGLFIDHVDGNRSNNKISNLVLTDRYGNARNQKKNTKNKTGVTGVNYSEKYREYVVTWRENGINRKKHFKVDDTNKNEIFKIACEFRKNKLIELASLGFHYAERHGK